MRKHVIIGGTGRAGTSFLVALLTKLGFDTGFTAASLPLHPLSRAGLELDIRAKNAPYIVKNPWLSQTLSEALQDPDVRIEHAIVPVRSITAATASRRRVDRLARREGTKLPGGLWLTDDPARQREMLERQFTRLFETLAQHEIPVTLLWFPRLIEDPHYLFRQLNWLLGNTDASVFERVFRETVRPDWVHEFPDSAGKQAPGVSTAPAPKFRGSPDEELRRGEVPYLDVLARLHAELAPSLYLEIGVRHGKSLALARGKAVGVDPEPDLRVPLPGHVTVTTQTSDAFFAGAAAQMLESAPELVFIDGMHHFEFALRDFINAERLMPPHGLIVIDDIFPNHPAQAERERRTGSWTGDVWKLKGILAAYRPDLYLLALDTAPTGLLLVAGLNARDDALQKNYASILNGWLDIGPPPAEVLSRKGALSPRGPELERLIRVLREAREKHLLPNRIREALHAGAGT